MDKANNQNFRDKITMLLREKNLKEAFSILKDISLSCNDWQTIDEINRQEAIYRSMLHYMTEGGSDPFRKTTIAGIINSLSIIADKLYRMSLVSESPEKYYSILRGVRMRPTTLAKLLQECKDAEYKMHLVNEASVDNPELSRARDLSREALFNWIWVNINLTSNERELLQETCRQSDEYRKMRLHILSAIFLSLTFFYDREKIIYLLDECNDEDVSFAARATIAFFFVAAKYADNIAEDTEIISRLALLQADDNFRKRIKDIHLGVIRTKDTARITDKVQKDIIPQLNEIKSEFINRFKDSGALIDLSNPEANPEWEEMLEKKGITDKLQELTEMQLEGDDVMMIAFANLKYFPFFRNVGNWFLPFDITHSSLASFNEMKINPIAQILESEGFLCDSDKYSLAFSMGSMPAQNRDMMSNQFQTQFEQLKEENQTSIKELYKKDSTKEILSFLRNLYRFYSLNPYKNEFYNPFTASCNYYSIPTIGKIIMDDEHLKLVGEFYFKRGYYADAINTFDKVIENNPLQSDIPQKMGFCYQSLGDMNNALKYYKRAEIIEPDNRWLLKKIASALRVIGEPQEALKYYKEIVAAEPENISALINYGHTLLDNSNISEALQNYYKADYLKPGLRTWRPIAWCEFLLGNYDKSAGYYDKIMSDIPSAQDWLNRGHLAFVQHDINAAVAFYEKSINRESENGFSIFASLLRRDKDILNRMGVDDDDISLLLDKIRYDIE
jgi:tetratricopeptide (TPR) repeat protein